MSKNKLIEMKDIPRIDSVKCWLFHCEYCRKMDFVHQNTFIHSDLSEERKFCITKCESCHQSLIVYGPKI